MGSQGRKNWVAPARGPCGKLGYLTRTAARKAAKKPHGCTMHVYRCPLECCNGLPWHITRQQRRS